MTPCGATITGCPFPLGQSHRRCSIVTSAMKMKTLLCFLALVCVVLHVDAMRSAPVLKDIPRRQHAALAARMVSRNLSIALEFEQSPYTSGAIFSIYAGPLPILLITSIDGHLVVEYLSHEKSQLKYAFCFCFGYLTTCYRMLQQPGTRCFDDSEWHNLYFDVQSTQCVITVDCQVKDLPCLWRQIMNINRNQL